MSVPSQIAVGIILGLLILKIELLIKRSRRRCPNCGGKLFRWNSSRLDCEECSHKLY